MARNSPEHLAVLERRRNVARRYVRGEPQWAIARAFEIDQGTVSRDLAAVRAEWLASAVRDFDAVKAQELARVDEVEAAAWQGWAKSQEAAEVTRAEVADDGEGETPRPRKKTVRQLRGQAGDAKFLAVILKCVERRCAILGVDAERRLKVTGLVQYANLTDDELDRRIADAQARTAGPAGPEAPAAGGGGPVEAPP